MQRNARQPERLSTQLCYRRTAKIRSATTRSEDVRRWSCGREYGLSTVAIAQMLGCRKSESNFQRPVDSECQSYSQGEGNVGRRSTYTRASCPPWTRQGIAVLSKCAGRLTFRCDGCRRLLFLLFAFPGSHNPFAPSAVTIYRLGSWLGRRSDRLGAEQTRELSIDELSRKFFLLSFR